MPEARQRNPDQALSPMTGSQPPLGLRCRQVDVTPFLVHEEMAQLVRPHQSVAYRVTL